jgi:hypothetical protein
VHSTKAALKSRNLLVNKFKKLWHTIIFFLSQPGTSLKAIKPSKQESQATHRPRCDICHKETGPGKVWKGKELGPTNKSINDYPRCRSSDKQDLETCGTSSPIS